MADIEQGERVSVAYADICPKCDGFGYTKIAVYLNGEACGDCRGSGKRQSKMRNCTACGRQMHSAREMHWECEIKARENENRATASGGMDVHQIQGGAAEHFTGRLATNYCVRCQNVIALLDHNPYDARRCAPEWFHATGRENWSAKLDGDHFAVPPYEIAEEP